jgi:RNA polymerase sigma-70 factor (ECF subfamily)
MTPEQEHDIIRRAREDPQAFVHLYDHYFSRVHAYIHYRVAEPDDAEDAIADVFLRALRQFRRFRWRGEGSFAAWLFRIAHNRVVDHYRRRRHLPLPLSSHDALGQANHHAPSPEQAVVQAEAFQQVRALVATLSPRRQEIITLRFFGGLRNREIARILGLDERTVAAHLSRGLRDLRRRHQEQVWAQPMAEVVV